MRTNPITAGELMFTPLIIGNPIGLVQRQTMGLLGDHICQQLVDNPPIGHSFIGGGQPQVMDRGSLRVLNHPFETMVGCKIVTDSHLDGSTVATIYDWSWVAQAAAGSFVDYDNNHRPHRELLTKLLKTANPAVMTECYLGSTDGKIPNNLSGPVIFVDGVVSGVAVAYRLVDIVYVGKTGKGVGVIEVTPAPEFGDPPTTAEQAVINCLNSWSTIPPGRMVAL